MSGPWIYVESFNLKEIGVAHSLNEKAGDHTGGINSDQVA